MGKPRALDRFIRSIVEKESFAGGMCCLKLLLRKDGRLLSSSIKRRSDTMTEKGRGHIYKRIQSTDMRCQLKARLESFDSMDHAY
jgi:hypothetical protein